MNRSYLIATEVPDWDRHSQPCAMGAAVEFSGDKTNWWNKMTFPTGPVAPYWELTYPVTNKALLSRWFSSSHFGGIYTLTQLKPYKLFLKCGSWKLKNMAISRDILYPPSKKWRTSLWFNQIRGVIAAWWSAGTPQFRFYLMKLPNHRALPYMKRKSSQPALFQVQAASQ